MTRKYNPLLDRVICLQDWGPTHHVGTEVEIPQQLREVQRPATGIVVAVGPGMWVNGTFCPVALQVGMHVHFAHPDTLTRVEDEGQEHLLMREQDVFGVLETKYTNAAWVKERNLQGHKNAILIAPVSQEDFDEIQKIGIVPDVQFEVDTLSQTVLVRWDYANS